VAEGHARKQVYKHLWRMHGRETYDDLMQEAFLVYARVHARYATKATNPAWLMSLYRESLHHHLIDLARRSVVRARSELVTDEVDISTTDTSEPVDVYDHALEAIERAPDEIRSVLLVLLKAPDELLEEIHRCACRSVERASRIMCALTGQPQSQDVWEKAREYLRSSLQ
jgi:hypothetical protein